MPCFHRGRDLTEASVLDWQPWQKSCSVTRVLAWPSRAPQITLSFCYGPLCPSCGCGIGTTKCKLGEFLHFPMPRFGGGMSSDFAGKEQKDGICRKRAKGLLSCRDVSLAQLLCCGAGWLAAAILHFRPEHSLFSGPCELFWP